MEQLNIQPGDELYLPYVRRHQNQARPTVRRTSISTWCAAVVAIVALIWR